MIPIPLPKTNQDRILRAQKLMSFDPNHELIVAVAARLRLPALYPFAFYAKEGGLISYGVDPVSLFQQGAGYVDRILRGAKPADLPVQYPTKFQLVVNLKTAKALDLAIPELFLQRADEVIE